MICISCHQERPLIDDLCHRCTANELEAAKSERNRIGMQVRAELLPKLSNLENDLRIARCAFVELKTAHGELAAQCAIQKARADAK